MRQIALYGGTFDPPHMGHMAMANAALHELQPYELRLIPAAIPAHRPQPQASADQRLDMVRLMADHDPRMIADRRELDRSTPSITIDTLRELQDEDDGATQWVFLLGEDSFASLDTWDQWRSLAELCAFAVFPRSGSKVISEQVIEQLGESVRITALQRGRWCWVEVDPVNISATEIRQRLKNAQSTQGLLLPEVAQYIEQHGLYQ